MRWRMVAAVVVLCVLVMTPFFLWEEPMTRFSEGWVSTDGASAAVAAMVVLLLSVDLFLPVPSSLVGVSAGALFGVALGAALVFIGLSACAALAYGLGRALDAARLSRFMSESDRRRTRRFYRRHGLAALALARPVPVLSEVSIILAGMSGLPPRQVMLYVLPANAGVALVYALVGHYTLQLPPLVLATLGAVAVAAALIWWRRHRAPAGTTGRTVPEP